MGVGTTRGVISSRRAVEQLQAPGGLQTECGIKSSYTLNVAASGFVSIPLVCSKKKHKKSPDSLSAFCRTKAHLLVEGAIC